MPLPTGRLEVRIRMMENVTGNVASVLLYYQPDTGPEPTVATVQGMADDFKTAFNTAVPACLTNEYLFHGVHIRWLGSTADVEAFNANGPTAGTRTGLTHPEEVAAVIQRRTGVQGRANRGRIFMPFVPLLFGEGSTLSTAGVEAYQSLGTMMHNTVTTTVGASTTTWKPRTPNFKLGVLQPIVQTRVLSELCSRRDRRFVKRGVPIPAAAGT